MTRIIAGRLGGRRIATPRGPHTRPTSDRVREAVFSRIEALTDLAGAAVLDLYAGSGALGLEAASRGAATVVHVEAHRGAAVLIRRTVRELGLGEVASVRTERVERVLRAGPGADEGFDLALLDPPYPLGEEELAEVLRLLVSGGWLRPGALVVVERSSRSPEPRWPAGLTALEPRRYGETAVHYARLEADDQ
jgi:16S rRNA (guanine966-N2)-methyltransferase